jgi:tRNA(Ile)-lysidine synthase
MDLPRKVTEFIKQHGLLFPSDQVLVAVSGGPDSVALLHLLYDLRQKLELRLEVAHLQHGIRGAEAREDARFVAELANKLGLPFHLKEVNINKIKSAAGKGNLEALARAERYRFFAAAAREYRLGKIATGHTLNDQAETVLMWLLRGAGLKGLGGMPPAHHLNGTNLESASRLIVIRPLLAVSRAEIEEYLREKHLTCRLDYSNQDPSLLRNWIRLKLIPQLEERTDRNLPARLARQAELIREEEELLDGLAHVALTEIRTAEGMARGSLLKHSKSLQRRVLRLWIEEVRGHLRGLDFQHVEALLDLIKAGPPQSRLAIPDGWELVKEYETLRLEEQSSNLKVRCPCYNYGLQIGTELTIPEAGLMIQAREITPPLARPPDNFMEAVFDSASLGADLRLRNFRPGDRFQPLGMTGHKKVKEVFIEKKVPLSVRASLPLLVLGGEVIWIPGYGRSEVAKVTSATQVILHLKAVLIRH